MKTLFTLVILSLSAGCASYVVKTDLDQAKDFSSYKTYQFAELKDLTGTGVLSNSLVRKRVESAVTKELTAKGLSPAGTGTTPDVKVSYWVGIKEKTEIHAAPQGTRYGNERWGPMYDDVVVNQFREGTLIVDVIEAKSNELAWRAYVTDVLSDKQKDNEKNFGIALAKAFESYPTAKK